MISAQLETHGDDHEQPAPGSLLLPVAQRACAVLNLLNVMRR